MFFKHGKQIFLLSSLALVLCACGGSDSGSGGDSGSSAGPSDGKITINFSWPKGTQPTDEPISCAAFNPSSNDYSIHYHTSDISVSVRLGFDQGDFDGDGIPHDMVSIYSPPSTFNYKDLPTKVAIEISTKGTVICGDQTGHWNFDWNNQSLKPEEEKIVNAIFVSDTGRDHALRLYDGTGSSAQNDRLGQGEAG